MRIYSTGVELESFLLETKEDGTKIWGWKAVYFDVDSFDLEGKVIIPRETAVAEEGLIE